VSRKLHITDHAVLRYLERVNGVDVKAARADIARRMEIARGHQGLCAVVSDGFRYKIKGRAVVTVLVVGDQAGKPVK
tara:strand:- start:4979 stop:5209 length:231 start_codon:yes stop_codon:yes gene_type:complete